jgi:uncharacterized membrane protein YgaE (UPF0421/DUF939 family)
VTRHELLSGAQLAARAAVAAALSIALARTLRLEYPIYALVAAVIVTDFSPAETRRLGWLRMIATVIGAVVGGMLRYVLEPSAWAIGVGILVAMVVCQGRLKGSAKVAGYISGIVMLEHGENPASYAVYRFVETALGIGVAWVISFVPRLIRLEEPPAKVGG